MKIFTLICALAGVTVYVAVAADSPDASARFYQAIRNDDLATLRGLIAAGGVDVKDKNGSTPLMYSGAAGSLQAMQLLVDAGAGVNAKNAFEATALMWSAGDIGKVRLLLAKGADVNARSKSGRTPLLLAASRDGASQIVKLMLDKGADVRVRTKDLGTVVGAAAGANDAATVRLLLAHGAEADLPDDGGFTALSNAAGNGNAEIVRMLLAKGANVNLASAEKSGEVKNGPIALGFLTPLHVAAATGGLETVKILVNAGAKVNALDVRGDTPLTFALATDHSDPRVIRFLLNNGADTNLKSKAGETPLDWARKYRDSGVLGAIGSQAPKVLPVAALAHTTPTIRQSVESGVAVMQRTSEKFMGTGGCFACHAQNITSLAVQAARTHGASVNATLDAELASNVVALQRGMEQRLLLMNGPGGGALNVEYSLLQIHAAGVEANATTDALVLFVAASQTQNGDWIEAGIARPPMEEGGIFTTALGLRSLQLFPIPGRKEEFDGRISRALAWLQRATPVTTQDRAMQLLGIQWATGKAPAARMKELLKLQRPDGGWAQNKFLASDAYATGEVLYTLHELGVAAKDAGYQRGVQYLLRTQSEDGSWHVTSRALGFQPFFQSGFPYDHDQWISQAGTAWAATGLAYALPVRTESASAR